MLTDFLDHELFPALYRVLDQAFPEFAFRARSHSWVATQEGASRALPGAPRPGRVECYANTPFGFTIHGGEFVPWLAYANGGQMPRGKAFVDVVTTIARKAGVTLPRVFGERGDTSSPSAESVAIAEAAQRQRELFETFLRFTRDQLRHSGAEHARRYLIEERGFGPETWDAGEFGYYPSVQATREHLRCAGFSDDEIGTPAGDGGSAGSGLLHDRRWGGRVIGAWRDIGGRIINFWARDLSGRADADAKYLMLKGGSKRTPFALHKVRGSGIIAVEGVMDALTLQCAGVENVVAVGGAGVSDEQISCLENARIKTIVLNFDNDDAGHHATEQSLQRLRGASLRVYVVNPSRMTEGEHDVKPDPDSFLRNHGIAAYRELVRSAPRGTLYLAERIFARHELGSPQGRDDAFDAFIPALEALRDEREREECLHYCARVLGYSYDTLRGLFDHHATRNRTLALQQQLTEALQSGQRALAAGEQPPLQIAQAIAGALARLQITALEAPQPFSVERLDEVTRHLPRGMPSGWSALDKLGGQFNAGELTVFGARTGHGKTTVQVNLLLNWLRSAASTQQGARFVFYSMEEPEVRIYHRLLAVLTAAAGEGWSANEVRDFLRDPSCRETWQSAPSALHRAREGLTEWERRLLIVHRPNWTIADIEAHVRAEAERHTIGGVMVDYLQRILVPQGEKYERRDIEVTVVARRLKALAESVSAPVVAAAQIGREAVREGIRVPDREHYLSREVQKAIRSRRPKLHQLREGGSEQEADFVLGLLNYRADYEMDDEERSRQEIPPVTRLEIGILKSRYGTPGHWATLAFEGRYGLLRDAGYGEMD